MKKIAGSMLVVARPVILLALILTSMLVVSVNTNVTKAESQQNGVSLPVDIGSLGVNGSMHDPEQALENAKVIEHEITVFEVEKLKEKMGVWQKGSNYNQLIGGHGTGLRPPTDEEWEAIAESSLTVDSVSLNSIQSASNVDHSTEPWFPPIGNQDGEGSCTCWAVGYYMKTFQEAMEHGWNVAQATWEGGYTGHPTPAYQDKIMSPDFIYHLINGGTDGGSSFYGAIQLVCFIGAC